MIREDFGVKVNLYDIDWDVENEEDLKNLPKDLEIKLDDKEICEILGEQINEYLAEKYGFCNKGYLFDYKSYYEEV